MAEHSQDLAMISYLSYQSIRDILKRFNRFSVESKIKGSYETEIIIDLKSGHIVGRMVKHQAAKHPTYNLHRIFLAKDFLENYKTIIKNF